MVNQMLCEKIAEESQRCHYGEGILVLQILDDCIIHEEAKLVSWLDQQSSQKIGHLFQVKIGGLAEVDRQDMGEGGVVAQCFEIDELDKDVGVLLRVARMAELHLHVLDLSANYFLFGRLVFGLADHLD